MSRRLYLHIGYPKTGTTAIQEFLFHSRSELLEAGVLYPETGLSRFSHHQIPWVFTRDERRETRLNESDIISGLNEELDANPCVSTVVISSEGFVFAMDPEEVKRIFSDMFDEIKLVVYLRQPFRWLQSDYNQGVKGWRKLSCSFDEYLQSKLSLKRCPMDFYARLSPWADAFDWGNIELRSFDLEKKDLPGGFLEVLGLSLGSIKTDIGKSDSNPRLDFEQIELYRLVNSLDLSEEDREWLQQQLQSSSEGGTKGSAKETGDEVFYYNTDNQRLLKINDSNKSLLRYFDRRWFDEDFFTVSQQPEDMVGQFDVEKAAPVVQSLVSLLLDARR